MNERPRLTRRRRQQNDQDTTEYSPQFHPALRRSRPRSHRSYSFSNWEEFQREHPDLATYIDTATLREGPSPQS